MSDSDMREEESGGLRFGDICRVVFRAKHLPAIIGSVVLAAILAFLIMNFLVNPRKVEYQADFNFDVVRTSSTSALYESGQFFAEEETLTAVKNSSENFSDVKIEEMFPEGKDPVKVSVETVKVLEDVEDMFTTHYSITVKGNLFPDAQTAQDFLKALINYPKVKALADTKALAVKDSDGFNGYGAQLKTYKSVLTYGEQLAALRAQQDYLLGFYDGWISSYGGLYAVQDNSTTLSALREAAQVAFPGTRYSEFSEELSANAYQESYNDATLRTRLATYEEQLRLNEELYQILNEERANLLDEYKNLGGTGSTLDPQLGAFNEQLRALLTENESLKNQIDKIQKKINNDPDYLALEQKFKENLDEVYDALKSETDKIAPIAEELVERESYTTLLEIKTEGGTSTLLITAVVAVVVFLIACGVCYSVAVRRDKKTETAGTAKEHKKETSEALPADNTPNTSNE